MSRRILEEIQVRLIERVDSRLEVLVLCVDAVSCTAASSHSEF